MHQFFLDVISGRRRGPTAGVVRGALSLCTPFYRLVVGLRNRRYDRGAAPVHHAGVPVVSIGNVTTGGTGKTPAVAWVVNELRNSGQRPGILSRGYRTLDGQENDEKRLLDRLCPDVPHVQNPDRVVAAERAVRELNCDVLVLDDGFQHRRLSRDLDIVLIDALNPWGYGRLLPRGLLREPPSSLRRAHLIVITRADQLPDEKGDGRHFRAEDPLEASADSGGNDSRPLFRTCAALRAEIARHTSADILESRFEPTGLLNAVGERLELSAARGRRIAAFSGIGNPAGFRATLAGGGIEVEDDLFRVFPDHHHYTTVDQSSIAARARRGGAELLLTTGKDLVKFRETQLDGIPLWAVEIAFQPVPAEPLLSRLQAL